MSFIEKLGQVAAETDALLDKLLAVKNVKSDRIIKAMRYAALAPGKRLRPWFVAESAKICGADHLQALRAGAALECVHCYSLVHDDLPAMDDDDLRRGRPTCHRQFDEATAILAGDGLLTFAFEILADEKTHEDANIRIELVSALAKASGMNGMVGGQMLDLEAEQRNQQTLEEIIAIQALKTGALFEFSLIAGAILAGADAGDRKALSTYSEKIGLAFQIADDILDIESSPEQLGKATQKDAEAGKSTFIDLYGLDGAKAEANRLVDEACDVVQCFGKRCEGLRQAAVFIVNRKK